MDETMLTLKPGVALTEVENQVGLMLNGSTQYAKDARQAEILRALVKQPQPIENLIARLHVRDGPPQNDHDISLTIAGFILDFGDYLKA